VALFKLYHLYSKEEQVDHFIYAKVVETKRLATVERSHAFEAQIAILVYLFYFKKVYKKIYLKKYRFIK